MKPRLVPRLLLPVLALSVLLLVTAVGSAWYLRSIQRQLSTALEENVASVVSGQRLESTVREIDASLDRYLLTGDPAHLEAVPDLADRGRDALREADAWAITDRERELMARAGAGYGRLTGVVEAARHPRAPDTRGRVAAVAEVPEREILGPAREYRRLNEDALAGTSRATRELADRLTVGLLALGLCGAGGGLLGGWVLTTGLRRSIERTEGRMRGAAARLRSVVTVPGTDDDPAEAVDVSVTAVLDRLRQVERDALRAEQLALVGQMAAGVAHEVRNPLMAIKLLVQAAADPHRAAPFRPRDLAVIEGEIGRLEGIVSGFLDFARPPAPDKQVVSLAPVVDGAVAALRGRADLQQVTLAVNVATAPAVHADPNQLRQVLHNLVGNAIDAQPGGGEVRVSAAAAGDDVELRVEDRGGGPPADLGERIFDPFVSTKPTGVGLGLSICRRIVESHGGAIRAAARPGGGAVFAVRLPRPTGADLTPEGPCRSS